MNLKGNRGKIFSRELAARHGSESFFWKGCDLPPPKQTLPALAGSCEVVAPVLRD